jgi:excisionase family DNA binding protein
MRMSAHMSTEPRFLTVAQAATTLGVSGPTVRRWVRDGHLVGVQVGGPDGVLRIPVDELERLIAEAREGTP